MNNYFLPKNFKKTFIFLSISLGGMIILHHIFPIPTQRKYSQVIYSEEGHILQSFLSEDDKWRMFSHLEEVSPELITAIINKEDKYFYYHIGINPISILRALFNNTTKGYTTSGASTITMQVARLLNPKPRTYINKCIELLRALQLEWTYSKDEILNIYLNLIPYGGNIEGVKAASILYLGKLPKQLSLAEAVMLSVIPNKPGSLALGKQNTRIKDARDKWLRRHKLEKVFPTELIDDAIEEPVLAKRRSIPRLAPHLSSLIHQQYPTFKQFETTIKVQHQIRAQKVVDMYMKEMFIKQIFNTSILVIDNNTREITAYLGSANFNDNAHNGQVNGVKATRSPGSTLKPFIYGCAMDLGLCTPSTIFYDVPTHFGNYKPENFDLHWRGPVPVREALAGSLNVPAVQLLNKIGVTYFTRYLGELGFKRITKDQYKLGLSVVLGGCGTNLWELAGAYSTLANQGLYRPISLMKNFQDTTSLQVMSPSAAYMISDILTDPERPDLPHNYMYSKNVPEIAWKTGTSYGRKDAWSIGYNKKYTIAVWLGNFNNAGVRELTGAQAATPLLFKLFRALDKQHEPSWLEQPHELLDRIICSETGLPAASFCENKQRDYYIPGVSNNLTCQHLQKVFVNADKTESYCTHCLPKTGSEQILLPNIAPQLAQFYFMKQIPYQKAPPHNPNCTITRSSTAPKITSLVDGNTYYLLEKDGALTLTCNAEIDAGNIYWYVNDQFIGRSTIDKAVFFKPKKGKNTITCRDDKGQQSSISIVVK